MNRPLAILSRFAAIALLLILVGGAYLAGVQPMIAAYQKNQTALLESKDLIARFHSIAATESGLSEEVQEVRGRQALQSYYLIKKTDALAAAELQDRVKSTVVESGGTVRSIQTLPGESEGEFRRVTLRLQMTATTEALRGIIFALETSEPFLFLDNVDIKARSARQTKQDEAEDPILSISMDLYGYRPPEEL